jgi:enoyl-CoA hydratase
MTDYKYLRWEVDGTVATVWLDRAPVNAVNQEMYREIRRLFSDISVLGDDVRVVVLAGAGKHFCAGNDLNEFLSMTPENAPDRMFEVRQAFFAIHDCPIPVIGAIQGTAVGTGLAIAASCDFVVAAEGAKLGVTEIAVGVMGAAKHLSRLVPQPQMRWMFFSGEPARVEDLVGLGALVAVVPPDELLSEARRRAEQIARHSPVAIRFAKRSLNQIEFMDLKSGYEFEQGLSGELAAYEDSKEAQRAFFERREPVYTGR